VGDGVRLITGVTDGVTDGVRLITGVIVGVGELGGEHVSDAGLATRRHLF
jgi:hypothetical protein